MVIDQIEIASVHAIKKISVRLFNQFKEVREISLTSLNWLKSQRI
jgi:hypothetical protein